MTSSADPPCPSSTTRSDPAPETLTVGSGSSDRQKSDGEEPDRTLTLSPADPQGSETQAFTAPPAETIAVGGELKKGSGAFRSQGNTSQSRFQVLRPHARGGLGEVYLAHDQELNREVALKKIQSKYADRPDSRVRFVIEAEITGNLEHPGIVPVYSLSQDANGCPFYVMRFIRGESLDQVIKKFHSSGDLAQGEHSLEFRQLLERFVAVCNTIAFAHSRRVLHRDLKPANVMLGPYGETLVVDWGLAKQLGRTDGIDAALPPAGSSGSPRASAETISGSAIGTPSFMSPEQSLGQLDRLGPASDVYSLGATLYVLLTGREPFLGASVVEILHRVQKGDYPHPRTVNRAIPAPLEAICMKAMALQPEDRYESARPLADEIEHWLADEPVSAYREPWRSRLARWGRRHRTWTQAGAVALCVVAIVAVLSALIVNGARRREHMARVRENQQRLLTEKLSMERRERLQGMRMEGAALFRQGEDALERQDWRTARLQLAKILAMTHPEPELADLTARALRLQSETEQRLVAQEAGQKARDDYQQFQKLRDDALFHGTLFTGLDLATDLEATRAAARSALALYGMDGDGSTIPIVPRASLSALEQEEVRTGCHELLLVLADAEATAGPDPGPDDRQARARRALRIIERAGALGTPTRSYHSRRAKYLEQLGDHHGAQEESARAAMIEPALAVDFFLLGEQAYKQSSLDQARRFFERGLRARPDYFWAQYFLAVCHLKADPPRPSEAKAHLTASLSRRPDFAWIYLLRGYAHGELGEFTEAESDFDRALQLGSDPGVRYGVLVNRGGMRIRQGNYDTAIADLTEAVRLKPRQDQAHANLGLAYGGQKRWDLAIEQLNIALGLAPEQAVLHRNRALIHLSRQDQGAALRDFGEAIRLAPGPSRTLASDHAYRGRILQRQQRWKEALGAYDAALELQPDDREVERLRAETLIALGRGTEAIQALNRYLDPNNTDPNALRQRGFERARMSDAAGALADFTRALALDPDSPATRARRGWGYLNEASKLALRDFEEAIKLDPKNGDLHNGRGLARVLLGDDKGAVADAEEALRLGIPGNELRARLALYYNAACIYAQAAAKATFTVESQERQALTRRYRDRAVALVRQALDLLPSSARPPFIKQAAGDPALDPIRAYPPFAQLAADLTGKQSAKP